MTYLEYRDRVEFNEAEYREIDRYCKDKGIMWFASCWDGPSVDFLEQFSPVCHKVCSAALTNDNLLRRLNSEGRPIILSTGMSTMKEIRHAVSLLNQDRLLMAHCTSSYACKPEELNLNMIKTLRREFNCPIGYSGHELGLVTTCAAVAIGASFVERHITLDRGMWGNDQKASLEPGDLQQLVRDIRETEKALGDGIKEVYESEQAALLKLRKIS
jgi:N-acetylneuraminate synthase